MFATLLGGLPTPEIDGASAGDASGALDAVLRAQEAAGLEPLTDGRLHDFTDLDGVVDRWLDAARRTDRAVKQALPGPCTLARRAGSSARAVALAERLRDVVDALGEAGCPLVEIEESKADRIGGDEAEREAFRDAHLLLAGGVTSTHLSLSIVGGSADTAGMETILAAPYASVAVDLIAGPDNWRLATDVAGDRGLIVGALGGRVEADEPKEILLYAAMRAATLRGRGRVRVGIGSAGGYEHLPWEVAVRKMRLLGEAARLAAMPPGPELASQLDPRAISSRHAALGSSAVGGVRRGTRPSAGE